MGALGSAQDLGSGAGQVDSQIPAQNPASPESPGLSAQDYSQGGAELSADDVAVEPVATATENPEAAVETGHQAPAAVEAPAAVDPASLGWGTIQNVRDALAGGTVPAAAAPYVEASLQAVEALRSSLSVIEGEYTQAKNEFIRIAAELEAHGADGATQLAKQTAGYVDAIESVSKDLSDIAHEAFDLKYPQFGKLPKDSPVRATITQLFKSGQANAMFPNMNYFSRLEQAYKYACYQNQVDWKSPGPAAKPAAPPQAQAPAVVPAAAPQATPAAKPTQQALAISDGGGGVMRPVTNIDEVSEKEIYDRYDHFLA